MEGILGVCWRFVDPRRGCTEIAWAGVVEGLIRPLVVLNFDKVLEALLLLKKLKAARASLRFLETPNFEGMGSEHTEGTFT
jgi:hypothetical protein